MELFSIRIQRTFQLVSTQKGVHTEEKRQETSAWHPLIQRQVGAGSGENDTGSYLRGQF